VISGSNGLHHRHPSESINGDLSNWLRHKSRHSSTERGDRLVMSHGMMLTATALVKGVGIAWPAAGALTCCKGWKPAIR
jgi:hypothetical protein